MELSYRHALAPRWSLETRLGGWASGERLAVDRFGARTPFRVRGVTGSLSLLREHADEPFPGWRMYYGLGVEVNGAWTRSAERLPERLARSPQAAVYLRPVIGWRYRFRGAPLELDLHYRPGLRVGGSNALQPGVDLGGFGVGLRWQFARTR